MSGDDIRLFAVGLDHRSSTAALRDRIFIAEGEMAGFLAALRSAGIDQAIVLSTCDRIEVQGAHREPAMATEAVLKLLARRAGEDEDNVRRQCYSHHDAAALRRIFGVAAALESQVIGEPQVLGQVKAAHRQSQAARMVGAALETVLQAAYTAAKRTRSETAIGERPVTLASAAVQLARDVHGDLAKTAGLLIGPGEMGELMTEHLRAAGLRVLTITGPVAAQSEAAARRLACHVAPFADLETLLAGADIILAALGSGRHIIGKTAMERALVRRRRRPVFVVDLGVPADVDPAIEVLDGVFRYDLDDLEQVTMSGRASRGAAAEEAWAIVEQELALFARQRAERGAVPAITALRRHFEEMRAQVMQQAGGDAARATELLVNRLLHDPSEALRRLAAGDGEVTMSREAVERALTMLFRLSEDAADEERKKS